MSNKRYNSIKIDRTFTQDQKEIATQLIKPVREMHETWLRDYPSDAKVKRANGYVEQVKTIFDYDPEIVNYIEEVREEQGVPLCEAMQVLEVVLGRRKRCKHIELGAHPY